MQKYRNYGGTWYLIYLIFLPKYYLENTFSDLLQYKLNYNKIINFPEIESRNVNYKWWESPLPSPPPCVGIIRSEDNISIPISEEERSINCYSTARLGQTTSTALLDSLSTGLDIVQIVHICICWMWNYFLFSTLLDNEVSEQCWISYSQCCPLGQLLSPGGQECIPMISGTALSKVRFTGP